MSGIGIVALGIATIAVGLFSGLMFSLIALLQLKWNMQTASAYIVDIQPFLKVGKGNAYVLAVLLIGLVAPIVALFGGGTTTTNVLILLGAVVFAVGALGVTVVFNLPTYTALMGLDADSPGDEWEVLRRRFYLLNMSRFIGSTTSFVLFVAAMASQIPVD